MKTKLFLMSATLLAALSLTGVASADTTRDQIEAEGNQQIQAYWNEYQQALQDRQNAWEQSHGDIYTPAWQDANAHAGAAYREWLEARTALGDRLHAYDVAQWEKESDQPSSQEPAADSQAPTTPDSQATTPTSQSAVPASQAEPSSQPAMQESAQQASAVKPASQSVAQAVQAKPTAQKPQQASVSVQADKTGNLPAQNKKPVQERTEQSSVATLPQTGNQAGLGAISIGIASALAMLGLAGVKRD